MGADQIKQKAQSEVELACIAESALPHVGRKRADLFVEGAGQASPRVEAEVESVVEVVVVGVGRLGVCRVQ